MDIWSQRLLGLQHRIMFAHSRLKVCQFATKHMSIDCFQCFEILREHSLFFMITGG
jgi:hypothetical protein